MKKQVICVGISNGCFTQYSMSGKNTSEAMNKIEMDVRIKIKL